ncbi:MAG: hypothetical protein ACQETM_07525 [Bacteroidota bacterium]
METLIIQSENSRDIKLLKEIVTKMGLKTAQLTHEQVEDIGLSLLMKEADRSKTVSRESVMEILDEQ